MNLNTSEILRSPRFKINLKSKIQNLFVVKWFLLKIEIYRSAMRCSRLKTENKTRDRKTCCLCQWYSCSLVEQKLEIEGIRDLQQKSLRAVTSIRGFTQKQLNLESYYFLLHVYSRKFTEGRE